MPGICMGLAEAQSWASRQYIADKHGSQTLRLIQILIPAFFIQQFEGLLKQ